jgi:hypothetical protein
MGSVTRATEGNSKFEPIKSKVMENGKIWSSILSIANILVPPDDESSLGKFKTN